jgi:hypothetical protein
MNFSTETRIDTSAFLNFGFKKNKTFNLEETQNSTGHQIRIITPRNFANKRRDTEFIILPRNFEPFRKAFEIYGNKKKCVEFRFDGIP